MSSNIRPLRSYNKVDHKASFHQFANDLQHAVQRYVPTDLGGYQKAAILGFTWSNDTTGVVGLRDELLRLLRKVYDFQTETYTLDANASSINVNFDFYDEVTRFIAKLKPKKPEANHLLMYYYSGYSDSGPQQDQFRLG